MTTSEWTLQRYGGVRITEEMKQVAEREAAKREPDIRHHFTTDHFTQAQSDAIGFFGEFAFRLLLGEDWKAGIRPDYKTIDSHDVLRNDWVIDVKTESIPARYIWSAVNRSIQDNEWFGRRLYHVGQGGLLEKYDIIFFGAVVREQEFEDIDAWFPIGWLPAHEVVNYPHGNRGPVHHSGKQIWYPFAAYQVTTTDLRSLQDLQALIRVRKPAR